jgi:hypothetical protein
MPIVGVLENMSGLICPHCGERIDLFSSGGGERTALEMGIPFLGKIPIRPEIVVSTDQGQPYVLSDGKAREDFKSILNILVQGGKEERKLLCPFKAASFHSTSDTASNFR